MFRFGVSGSEYAGPVAVSMVIVPGIPWIPQLRVLNRIVAEHELSRAWDGTAPCEKMWHARTLTLTHIMALL